MKLLVQYFVLISLSSIVGCSSIINGTTQKVSVNSNVQGAQVFIDGNMIGNTPVLNARIKRKDTSLLTIKKEGYKEYQQTLQTKFDPWFWGNIIIGGVFGSATDFATGTTHLLDPDTLFVQLEPAEGSSLKGSSSSDERIRSFVVSSYTSLKKEILIGSGDYLKSLLKLMKVDSSEKQDVVKKLKVLLELNDDVTGFADSVAEYNAKR